MISPAARLLCRLLALTPLAACGGSDNTSTSQTTPATAGAGGGAAAGAAGAGGSAAGAGGSAAGAGGEGGSAAGSGGVGGAAGAAGSGGAAGSDPCGGSASECTITLCYPVTDSHPLPCDPVTDPQMVLGCMLSGSAANFEGPGQSSDPTTGATLCCYSTFCGGGRPLILGGKPRVAALVAGAGWGSAAG